MSDATGARTPLDFTTGWVPDSLDVLRDYTGQGVPTGIQMKAIIDSLLFLMTAFNGGISFGTAKTSEPLGNLAAQVIGYVFTEADVVYTIPHGLGRKPVGYIPLGIYMPEGFDSAGEYPPALIACGSNATADIAFNGPDNRPSGTPTDWDNRVVKFFATGGPTWFPLEFKIALI